VYTVLSLLENLPEEVSPGQAIWCPNDLGVVCVGWWHVPYRLGLVYCTQRRSALFHIDLRHYTCTTLGPTDHAVSNPVFSRDGTRLVFLDNNAGGPHRQCSRLAMCDWCAVSLLGTTHTHTHTHLMALCPGLPRVSRYQKGKTNLDFTEARDSEWQWNRLGQMQVCTSLQTENHASTRPLSFYMPDALPARQPTAS